MFPPCGLTVLVEELAPLLVTAAWLGIVAVLELARVKEVFLEVQAVFEGLY